MSDWDEKAEDYAQAHHVYEHRDMDSNYHGFRMVVEGARWQRSALTGDATVEKAAHGIHASHDRGDWDEELPVVQDEYLDMARAALAAALGEEGNDE